MSVTNNLKENVKNKDKYDIYGFPWVLHLWILAYVPLPEETFSRLDVFGPRNSFICQRFVQTNIPSIPQIVNLEALERVKMTDEELDEMVKLVENGYRSTIKDWAKKSIDVSLALEEIARQTYPSFATQRVQTQPASTSDKSKLDELYTMVQEAIKKMNEGMKTLNVGMDMIHKRLFKIEEHLNIRGELVRMKTHPVTVLQTNRTIKIMSLVVAVHTFIYSLLHLVNQEKAIHKTI
ncbi:hypothetical protein AALP_AAs65934U000100 [Arabis alpina]|uniref:Uncharacterized protein n=1 Tax=Arabis alpina TaxID=50452 RepID=A0A087G3R0_ARAAL|nr:hypothetical protein AALP_AAs65934U000100 [Arabis alpina]